MLQNGAVLLIAAGEIPDSSVLQQPDSLGKFLNEVPVVGYEQQHPLEFLDGRLHPFPGGNVQVVGRLIQNQQVDFLVHQHTQPQPGLLTAGQVPHLLEHILPLEQERTQPISGSLRRAVLFVEHGVVKASLRVVKVDDLGKIPKFYRRAELNLALTVLLAQKALEEGGFSRAVVAKEGDPLPALYAQVNVREERPIAKGLGNALHFEDDIPGKILFSEGGLHGSLFFGLFRPVNSLHPVLDGHGTAVKGSVVDAPALHPLQGIAQLLQLGLLLLVLLHLQIEPSLLFVHVEGIVAGIELRVTVGNLNDPVGHLIDKIPIVGNGQHRSFEGVDILLQPFHAPQIQVVGGLIQQQNIRLFQQQPGKVHPGLFPAGKAGKFLASLFGRNAKTVADLVHLHIHVVAAAGLEPVCKAVILPQLGITGSGCHLPFQSLHPATQAQKLRKGRAKHILHGKSLRKLRDLGNEAQLLVWVYIDLPGIIVQLAGEDIEQGGLSAAISAQDGHALPLLNLKAEVFQ